MATSEQDVSTYYMASTRFPLVYVVLSVWLDWWWCGLWWVGQAQAVDANGSCWAVLFPAVGPIPISSSPAWLG